MTPVDRRCRQAVTKHYVSELASYMADCTTCWLSSYLKNARGFAHSEIGSPYCRERYYSLMEVFLPPTGLYTQSYLVVYSAATTIKSR